MIRVKEQKQMKSWRGLFEDQLRSYKKICKEYVDK